MTNISKLQSALSLISSMEEFNQVSFIATLGWSSIPEIYKLVKSVIVNGARIEVYSSKSTTILNIRDVGLFQII